MNEIITNERFENGDVNISEDVISIISSIAAMEVEGVARMSTGIAGEITEMLGMKNASKGVAVKKSNESLIIEIFIAIKPNVKINELGIKVQQNVKDKIETMTGLEVLQVNVNVQEIDFSKYKKDTIEESN